MILMSSNSEENATLIWWNWYNATAEVGKGEWRKSLPLGFRRSIISALDVDNSHFLSPFGGTEQTVCKYNQTHSIAITPYYYGSKWGNIVSSSNWTLSSAGLEVRRAMYYWLCEHTKKDTRQYYSPLSLPFVSTALFYGFASFSRYILFYLTPFNFFFMPWPEPFQWMLLPIYWVFVGIMQFCNK